MTESSVRSSTKHSERTGSIKPPRSISISYEFIEWQAIKRVTPMARIKIQFKL